MKTKHYDATFLCFLDIMGFKDIVNNNSQLQLTKFYTNLISNSIDGSVKIWQHEKLKDWDVLSELKSVIVSDSIILWTADVSPQAFLKIVTSVQSILFHAMFNYIPLRGAISIGPLTVLTTENNTTLFGKSLVKAYTLEQNQDWSGCIIDDECIECYNSLTKSIHWKRANPGKRLQVEDLYFLSKFPVPMKSGKVSQRWAFDWTKLLSPTTKGYEGPFLQGMTIVKAFRSYKKNHTDWRIENLLRNTLEFWNYCMREKEFDPDQFIRIPTKRKKKASR